MCCLCTDGYAVALEELAVEAAEHGIDDLATNLVAVDSENAQAAPPLSKEVRLVMRM